MSHPLSSCSCSLGMQDYRAVEQRGLLPSVAEAAGRPFGSGLLAGSSPVWDHTEGRHADDSTEHENERFCLCLVGEDGRKKAGVLGTVPSRAVDGSVGRFKGRHTASSEAVRLISPLFSASMRNPAGSSGSRAKRGVTLPGVGVGAGRMVDSGRMCLPAGIRPREGRGN